MTTFRACPLGRPPTKPTEAPKSKAKPRPVATQPPYRIHPPQRCTPTSSLAKAAGAQSVAGARSCGNRESAGVSRGRSRSRENAKPQSVLKPYTELIRIAYHMETCQSPDRPIHEEKQLASPPTASAKKEVRCGRCRRYGHTRANCRL